MVLFLSALCRKPLLTEGLRVFSGFQGTAADEPETTGIAIAGFSYRGLISASYSSAFSFFDRSFYTFIQIARYDNICR